MPQPAMSISDFQRFEHPPEWEFQSLAWLDAGIVVGTRPRFDVKVPIPQQPDVAEERLKLLDMATNTFSDVPIPPVAGCTRLGQTAPHRLPDGRLGYNAHCADRSGTKEGITTFLYAYDFRTRQSERLLGRPIPALSVQPRTVLWDDDFRAAVLSGEEHVVELTEAGVQPFRFDDVVFDFSYGVARAPGSSRIVFAASTERGEGVAFRSKIRFRAGVYTAARDGSDVTKLYEDVWGPGAFAISGDGRWVAGQLTTDTKRASREDNTNVWLLDTSGGSARPLVQTASFGTTWSPDGRELAMIASKLFPPAEEYSSAPQLYLADVGALLQ